MSESISTTCVQGGYRPGDGEPRQIPIYQSTTWKYDTSEHMGRLFDLEEAGYFYTRLANPTNDFVAAKIAELEGGTAAMLTSSGQAANFFAVFNIAGAGDHVVASSAIYGGTYNLLAVTMKRMGLECTFVSPDCTDEELEAAFRPNTKAVFGETIANPALAVLDIERFAAAAHAHGVPLIVDNTFPTPVNCRPIEWGADIVTHSTTKYMDGHGASVGGAIVDSGKFDWTAHADKFPGLCEPDESYHGVTYTERFGLGGAFITKATAQLMRDFGAIQSPQNAYLVNLGLESLHLRMAQHSKNGLALAQHLAAHPKIAWVRYPGLPGDDQYELAQKYLPNGASGVVSFGVAGGRAAAETFMANLKLAQIATHVADARTCVLHPANATHRQMNDAELAAAGITPDLIRLSCGIEATEDLVADIDQALALLLVGIFAVANAVGDSNAMRRGIDEGFELRGTYQGDPGRDGIGTIAFQTLDGEPSWEASKAPGAHVKGAFKETVDPNIYVLEDESGNGVGWVHLAYSDAQGAGALYVRYGAGDLVEMRKVDRVPGYMRYDNERNT